MFGFFAGIAAGAIAMAGFSIYWGVTGQREGDAALAALFLGIGACGSVWAIFLLANFLVWIASL